jgi:hypothetical protein
MSHHNKRYVALKVMYFGKRYILSLFYLALFSVLTNCLIRLSYAESEFKFLTPRSISSHIGKTLLSLHFVLIISTINWGAIDTKLDISYKLSCLIYTQNMIQLWYFEIIFRSINLRLCLTFISFSYLFLYSFGIYWIISIWILRDS